MPTRRDLVHAAALLPLQTVRGSQANSAVKVGLIGAGGRGTLDASLVAKDPNARLTAICDLFDEPIARAKKAIPATDAAVYKNLEELLASDVDAVIIATPVFLHPEHLEAALKAGKHVYIEKPAGADAEGARRVMRAADAAGRRLNLAFGFQQRYGPGYRKAHALVTSGGIGNLRLAHSHWIKSGLNESAKPVPKPTNEMEKIRYWKYWRETFGDYIVETYCHGVDVLCWFLGGHPESAYGIGERTIVTRGDMRDHSTVTFTWPGRIQATLTGTQLAPAFHRDVREMFYGSSGVVETAREYWRHQRGKTEITTEREPRDITADALEEFVRRVREGKPENAGVSAAESTLAAIMARTSMDLRREVAWSEVAGPGGRIALFNGRDLTGWEGDRDLWRVENGVIVGSTDNKKIDANTFLIYEKPFADFHLSADVRLRNGNSGIQFRSRRLPGEGWIAGGYQADCSEAGENSAWGNFYEERGRGRDVMKTRDEGWRKGKSLVRAGGWNTIEVIAQGPRIRILLNGEQTVEANDSAAASGIIALQLHRGDPMRVEFRNLWIRPL